MYYHCLMIDNDERKVFWLRDVSLSAHELVTIANGEANNDIKV